MYNSTTLQRRSPLAIAVALALGSFLAACGGSDTPASSNDTIAPARIVSVVAATGKAVAGSVISVYDANKDKVGASAADASGKVNIAISAAAKAPFLITTTTASGDVLYTVSLKEKTVNLTPLTSVIAMQLLGSAPASAPAASLAAIDAAKLQAAQTQLGTALAAPLQTLGMAANYDFVNGALTPGSKDPADVLLDNLQVRQNGSDIDIVNASGSIVAQILNGGTCIRDRVTGQGGMNHFMLPDGGASDSNSPVSASMRYGTYAMEVLINELLKSGARRENLEAKVFGGGAVLKGFTAINVGERNAAFVISYLKTERIRVLAEDLNDIYPRKVYFFPRSGKVLVKKLMQTYNDTLARRELDYASRLKVAPVGGEIDLF